MQACQTIIGIDRVPERLKLASALGATHVINTADENIDIKEEIQRVTGGRGSSITIDTTGNMGLIRAGLDFTANRGQLIFVGVPPLDAMMDLHLVTFMQVCAHLMLFIFEVLIEDRLGKSFEELLKAMLSLPRYELKHYRQQSGL
jgi:Zn-dependent alcohol dehydrogenase